MLYFTAEKGDAANYLLYKYIAVKSVYSLFILRISDFVLIPCVSFLYGKKLEYEIQLITTTNIKFVYLPFRILRPV